MVPSVSAPTSSALIFFGSVSDSTIATTNTPATGLFAKIYQLRHTGEEFRNLRHADADGEGGRGDDGVALVKAALAQHRDARDDDRAEQHVELFPEALGQRVIDEARRERDDRDEQILPRAGGIDRGTRERGDTGREQAEADRRHDTRRDDRADEPPPVFRGQSK